MQIGSFKPRPASFPAPVVVKDAPQPRERGVVDTIALGNRIDPEWYEEEVREAEERARNRPR